MKDVEVHQFKSKLEAKRGVFCSFNVLEESEWNCMLEKAKASSRAYIGNRENISTTANSIFSFLSSKKLSAALSFALIVVLLASFALSSSLSVRDNSSNNRILRQRRSVPVINVSSRYI